MNREPNMMGPLERGGGSDQELNRWRQRPFTDVYQRLNRIFNHPEEAQPGEFQVLNVVKMEKFDNEKGQGYLINTKEWLKHIQISSNMNQDITPGSGQNYLDIMGRIRDRETLQEEVIEKAGTGELTRDNKGLISAYVDDAYVAMERVLGRELNELSRVDSRLAGKLYNEMVKRGFVVAYSQQDLERSQRKRDVLGFGDIDMEVQADLRRGAAGFLGKLASQVATQETGVGTAGPIVSTEQSGNIGGFNMESFNRANAKINPAEAAVLDGGDVDQVRDLGERWLLQMDDDGKTADVARGKVDYLLGFLASGLREGSGDLETYFEDRVALWNMATAMGVLETGFDEETAKKVKDEVAAKYFGLGGGRERMRRLEGENGKIKDALVAFDANFENVTSWLTATPAERSALIDGYAQELSLTKIETVTMLKLWQSIGRLHMWDVVCRDDDNLPHLGWGQGKKVGLAGMMDYGGYLLKKRIEVSEGHLYELGGGDLASMLKDSELEEAGVERDGLYIFDLATLLNGRSLADLGGANGYVDWFTELGKVATTKKNVDKWRIGDKEGKRKAPDLADAYGSYMHLLSRHNKVTVVGSDGKEREVNLRDRLRAQLVTATIEEERARKDRRELKEEEKGMILLWCWRGVTKDPDEKKFREDLAKRLGVRLTGDGLPDKAIKQLLKEPTGSDYAQALAKSLGLRTG